MEKIIKEIERLAPCVTKLNACVNFTQKKSILLAYLREKKNHEEFHDLFELIRKNSSDCEKMEYVLMALIAIKQAAIVFHFAQNSYDRLWTKIEKLLQQLIDIEQFYSVLGGIVGYHLRILQLLASKDKCESNEMQFHQAQGMDISHFDEQTKRAVIAGIEQLKDLAEIYPIGGLGDRLNLTNDEKEPLPAACLRFLGCTLLEGLIRDLQAREYVYYKIHQEQLTTPIAMMTSLEKNNDAHIRSICATNQWFGRPQESFRFFVQISAPVITKEGHWSMLAPLELNLKPGGHGVLWKHAQDNGVLNWLLDQNKTKLLVRQINNPIGGIDYGLLAFYGVGCLEKKTFGLASCARLINAAEGVLVLAEKKINNQSSYTISNIEYPDFTSFGIEDVPGKTCLKTGHQYSIYPANTNILFVDLKKMHSLFKRDLLPGMLINMKTKAPFFCPSGKQYEIEAGRLETMMQSISDEIVEVSDESAATYQHKQVYLTYNERRKTISATKKSYESGKPALETPEGVFYDYLVNCHELLSQYCHFELPAMIAQNSYLECVPPFFFFYHPAIGPIFSVIGQKIRSGQLSYGSYLQLEIAEVDIENLTIMGGVKIIAHSVLGSQQNGLTTYNNNGGKCELKNVIVKNLGIASNHEQCYWKNQITLQEVLKIELEGNAEFYAEDVVFEGAYDFKVPNGERWHIMNSQKKLMVIKEKIEIPTWHWDYEINNQNEIKIYKNVEKAY